MRCTVSSKRSRYRLIPSSFCTPTELPRSPSSDISLGANSRTSWVDAWMASTAGRAASTVAAPSLSLANVAPPAPAGSEARNVLRRAALLARASNALASPRRAFCASNGIRCTSRDSCSAGTAMAAEPCVNAVRAAAAARQSTTSTASRGSILVLGPLSFRLFILSRPNSTRGLQEALALDQTLQTEHRPDLAAAAKGARKITVAAYDRRRCFGVEFRFRKPPEPQHLIHHQAGRNVPMIDHYYPRVAPRHARAAAEELPQVQHRHERSANVCQPPHPILCARNPRYHRGIAQHLAGFFPGGQKSLPAHAKGYAHPFLPRAGFRNTLRRHRAAAFLQFLEQFEWSVAQAAQASV